MEMIGNGKVRRTESQWREVLEKFDVSGLSQMAFCEREGVAQTSFQKWRRKLLSKKAKDIGPFVELPAQPSPATTAVELSFPSGLVVRIGG